MVTARNHRKQLRQAALLVSLAWFLHWGHAAYVSARAHDRAEAAEVEAESRRDWASAYQLEQARKEATQALIRSISWGFFIPLAMLVVGEAHAAIRRIRDRDAKKGNR